MKGNLDERPDNFQREILDLLKSRRLCDGEIFLIDEQKIFHVHKVIMAAGSPYFKAVFTCGMRESVSGRVELSGISADVMDTIIKYAYTNHVKITEENVEALFIAAHRLLVFSVCKLCADYIISKLSVLNCVGFYQFSKFYTYESLVKKCWYYLLENFTVVLEQSEEFLLLSAHELGYILEDDYLNIKNEESVFYACERWIQYEPMVRMRFAPELLSCLRVKQSQLELIVKNLTENQAYQPSKVRASLITSLDGIRLIRGLLSERPRIPSEVIFITGGYGSDSTLPHIETYDVRVNQWFLFQNSMHYRRAYHGTVVLRKQIFILGGYSDNQYYNGVHRFDISTGQWRELSPMHFSRCYVACAALNGRIFACGGHDGIRRHSSVESYCRSTNQWNLVSPMRQKRSDAAIVSLKGKLYVCGGFNGQECLDTMEMYDAQIDQWSLLERMSTHRSGVGMIGLNSHLYAIGGFNGNHRLKTVEKYHIHSKRWSRVNSMPTRRSNFAVAILEGLIYVIGGYDGRTVISSVECYNPVSGQWISKADILFPRSALSAVTVKNLEHARRYTFHGHQNRHTQQQQQQQQQEQQQQEQQQHIHQRDFESPPLYAADID